jgi:hypothetical protein
VLRAAVGGRHPEHALEEAAVGGPEVDGGREVAAVETVERGALTVEVGPSRASRSEGDGAPPRRRVDQAPASQGAPAAKVHCRHSRSVPLASADLLTSSYPRTAREAVRLPSSVRAVGSKWLLCQSPLARERFTSSTRGRGVPVVRPEPEADDLVRVRLRRNRVDARFRVRPRAREPAEGNVEAAPELAWDPGGSIPWK